MSKTLEVSDEWDKLKTYLERIGWKVLDKPKKNENGADMTIINDKLSYRIEIKVARKLASGSWQVNPVEPNRRVDDFIAIFISGQWIFRKMTDHLKLCSENGYNAVTEIARLLGS